MRGERLLALGVYALRVSILLLALIVGFVGGSTADLYIFILVHPFLPPPWRWLPSYHNYSVPHLLLLGILMLLLLVARWMVPDWKRLMVGACVVSWLISLVSHIVVEVVRVREGIGSGMEGGELIISSMFVASAEVVMIVILFFIFLAIVHVVYWLYLRLSSLK
jgi:hypothetical protein